MVGKGCIQCFHFQGIFLVLAKSKEFFKEFQKFKGISRKFEEREGNYSEIQGIQINLSKMQGK